jgi:hypothetical protein
MQRQPAFRHAPADAANLELGRTAVVRPFFSRLKRIAFSRIGLRRDHSDFVVLCFARPEDVWLPLRWRPFKKK